MPRLWFYEYPVYFFFWLLVCRSESYLYHEDVMHLAEKYLRGNLLLVTEEMLFRSYLETKHIRGNWAIGFVNRSRGDVRKVYAKVMLDWSIYWTDVSGVDYFAAILEREPTVEELSKLYQNGINMGKTFSLSDLDRFDRMKVVRPSVDAVRPVLVHFMERGWHREASGVLASTRYALRDFKFSEQEERLFATAKGCT